MIFNKTTYDFQKRSNAANTNFINDNNFIVIDDNSEIAKKIEKYYPFIKIIENENGEIIDVVEDIEKREEEKNIESKLFEIELLKQKLLESDYKAIKYAEEQISKEDYSPIKEQRQSWRDRINQLESELEVQNEGN